MSSPRPLMKLELCRVLGEPRHPTRISGALRRRWLLNARQKAYGYDEAQPPAQATVSMEKGPALSVERQLSEFRSPCVGLSCRA